MLHKCSFLGCLALAWLLIGLPSAAIASTATMPNDSDGNNDGSVQLNLGMQQVVMDTGSATYTKTGTTYTITSAKVNYTNLTSFGGIQIKDRFFLDGFDVNLGVFGPVASSSESTITLAANEVRTSQWTVGNNYSPYSSMVVTTRSKFGSQGSYGYYLQTNSF
jgi:hypothetical protein